MSSLVTTMPLITDMGSTNASFTSSFSGATIFFLGVRLGFSLAVEVLVSLEVFADDFLGLAEGSITGSFKALFLRSLAEELSLFAMLVNPTRFGVACFVSAPGGFFDGPEGIDFFGVVLLLGSAFFTRVFDAIQICF